MGGSRTNIGFHIRIPFRVNQIGAGTYTFRMHADYGLGSFIGVDGAEHTTGDIWGHVNVEDIRLGEGDHTFEALGFEGCCDGHSELDVQLPTGTDWIRVTTGANDALVGACSGPLEVANCDGSPLTPAANQMIAFGCINHEVVQCGYNSNNAVDDYAGALSAFADCITASGGDGSAWPYCNIQVEVAQGLNAQGSCPGGGNNGGGVGIGFHTIVPFTVTCADTYHFRFHTDYGRGGFIGVNDDAELSNTQASSASGSATDIWGHVEVNDIPLTAGDHVFEGLGFEGCCDGHSELDVHLPFDGEGDPVIAQMIRVKTRERATQQAREHARAYAAAQAKSASDVLTGGQSFATSGALPNPMSPGIALSGNRTSYPPGALSGPGGAGRRRARSA